MFSTPSPASRASDKDASPERAAPLASRMFLRDEGSPLLFRSASPAYSERKPPASKSSTSVLFTPLALSLEGNDFAESSTLVLFTPQALSFEGRDFAESSTLVLRIRAAFFAARVRRFHSGPLAVNCQLLTVNCLPASPLECAFTFCDGLSPLNSAFIQTTQRGRSPFSQILKLYLKFRMAVSTLTQRRRFAPFASRCLHRDDPAERLCFFHQSRFTSHQSLAAIFFRINTYKSV